MALVECPSCGLAYDDLNRWTICPHGPLWAPSKNYCRRCDLVHWSGICPYSDGRGRFWRWLKATWLGFWSGFWAGFKGE